MSTTLNNGKLGQILTMRLHRKVTKEMASYLDSQIFSLHKKWKALSYENKNSIFALSEKGHTFK